MRCSIGKHKGHNRLNCRPALNTRFCPVKTANKGAELQQNRPASKLQRAETEKECRRSRMPYYDTYGNKSSGDGDGLPVSSGSAADLLYWGKAMCGLMCVV